MNDLFTNRMRANTEAFIDADPLTITLERTAKEDDGEGGKIDGDPEEVVEQTFRLIPQGDAMPVFQTIDGFQRTPTYILLGKYDADMENGDYFTVGEHRYQIVSPIRPVHTDSAYEKKGDVALV